MRHGALAATAGYLIATLALTWPLARGLARDVPSDLGDPLLVMWIVSWGAEQLRAILGGDWARIGSFFDANIFHPSPLTLAYSEHLFAQALQILPVYVTTANPILCYNLLFLSTFVLSGLGVFLLVREMTGNTPAAFLAGLLFAFAPYRWAQAPHLQVLSAHWMPFALYGFRRYFARGSTRALALATLALVAQNLSSMYYLLYFAPVAGMYVLWEIASRDRWRDGRMWIHLAGAAAVIAAATLPFLLPYQRVREALQLSRDVREIVRYSADVYSYFTASELNRFWGPTLRAYPKPEGDLFPGLIPVILAGAAVLACAVRVARLPASGTRHSASGIDRYDPTALPNAGRGMPMAIAALRTRQSLLFAIAAIGLAYALLATVAIFWRRIDVDLILFSIRATDVTRLLVPAVAAAAAIVWLSPAWRMRVRAAAQQPEAIYLALLVLAWWLSLGPLPQVLGRLLDLWSPYRLLSTVVPGFDGVRVPARFAMIVALALAVLAGLGAARLLRGRLGTFGVVTLAVAFLAETLALPFPINRVPPPRDYRMPDARVYRPARAPAVYHELARAPRDAVVLEMPLGELNYDLRAVYYSTAHWRKLVNGYSGYFPPHYDRLLAILPAAARGDEQPWQVLQELGVTHVVVHEAAYLDDEGVRVSAWLRAHGAVELYRDASDVLFALP